LVFSIPRALGEMSWMNARGIGPMTACLLLDLALVCTGGNSRAHAFDRLHRDDTVEIKDGLLTVRVASSPASLVLDIIERHSGVAIRSNVAIDERVTASFRDVPLAEGLTRILKNRSVVFIYSNDVSDDSHPRLVEVHIYPGSAARPDVVAAFRPPLADIREHGVGDRGPDGPGVRSWRDGGDQPDQGASGGVAVRHLGQVLAHDEEPAERARAAKALARIGDDEAITRLAASIASDPDTSVREAAVASLGKTWSEPAVAPLAQVLLDNQRLFVREAAARALGETWSEEAVGALASALSTDSRQSVRETAAEALGKIGGAGAVDALVAALGDAHSSVRESAAAALGAIGRREALDVLIQISLTDTDSWVRQSAERAAAKILKSQ